MDARVWRICPKPTDFTERLCVKVSGGKHQVFQRLGSLLFRQELRAYMTRHLTLETIVDAKLSLAMSG